MATNKHATIRYRVLDYCFSNFGRKYFIDDLIDACNDALKEYSDVSDGIKRRQIFEDIKFMESEQGWAIPLERFKDGRQVYYRYDDKQFSINKQPISQTEALQLKDTLFLLTRFKGLPQFEWMEEILVRIESTFLLTELNHTIVGFEQNPYLKGLSFFNSIFSAIQNKRTINVEYKGFKQEKAISHQCHPYFLKQYNNRWFLYGLNEEYKTISNFALDRIISIQETNLIYVENDKIDFDEYFEDVVGVTVQDIETEKILLEIKNSFYPYIESKPIHGSQKEKLRNETFVTIELDVQINYELTSLLFSFGENVKIITPESLQELIKNKAQKLLQNYF